MTGQSNESSATSWVTRYTPQPINKGGTITGPERSDIAQSCFGRGIQMPGQAPVKAAAKRLLPCHVIEGHPCHGEPNRRLWLIPPESLLRCGRESTDRTPRYLCSAL